MSGISCLAGALNQQMYLGKFDYLASQLGAELVSVIPTHNVEMAKEGDYPCPWKNSEQLPADVVRGVFPKTERPFLAVRYLDTKVNQCIVEVFFQRYSHAKLPTQISLEGETMVVLSDGWMHSKWASSLPCGGGICTSTMDTEEFGVLKSLLLGESLATTGGRYLPLYEARFKG